MGSAGKPCGAWRLYSVSRWRWDRRGIAQAQNATYPNHPIRMFVGFAAGGGTDVAARIMAQTMSKILGQSIVVENRTGASGLIAAQDLAKSDPDGYTLMMGSQTTCAVAPSALSQSDRRPGEGFLRRRAHRRLAAGAGGQSVICRPFGGRRDRHGQGQSRQDQFRHRRRRHDAAYDRRTVSVQCRHQHGRMSPIAAKPAPSTICSPDKFH